MASVSAFQRSEGLLLDTDVATSAPDGGKAQRVYLSLRDEITSGSRLAGNVLDGEHALARSFGVARVTVRRALAALVEDGLIERRPGLGTVVRAPACSTRTVTADCATLLPQLLEMDQQTTARLLAFAYVDAPASVAKALRLDASERVQRAVRVRSIEGQPFSHLTTHVPEAIASGYSEADLATMPLFRLLERSGVRVDHAQQTISATLATPETAPALELQVGAALIALTRVVYDEAGRGIEHLQALYRPDRFRLEMSLSRVGDADSRHWAPVPMADELIERAAE